MTEPGIARLFDEGRLFDALGWAADSPLFLDARQVEAFYDAIVRPATRQVTLTTKAGTQSSATAGNEQAIDVAVEGGFSALLKAKFGYGHKETESAQRSRSQDDETTFEVVDTPHRQLQQLLLVYSTYLPDRFAISKNVRTDTAWSDAGFISKSPRALVAIELPRLSVPIPMALEVQAGEVVEVHKELYGSLPSSEDKATYWEFVSSFFEPTAGGEGQGEAQARADSDRIYRNVMTVLRTLEMAVARRGPLTWVDYRVPLGPGVMPLHLHLRAHGAGVATCTGDFAYKFVKRTYQHGMRLFGTLKSGPDLNVLAAFEI